MFFRKNKKQERLFGEDKRKTRKNKQKSNIDLKNTEAETHLFRVRIYFGCAVVVLCFFILFANLYYLQVISYNDYQTRSNQNRIRVLPVAPQRGIIYDRNHVVLAENRPVFHLVIFPNTYKADQLRQTLSEVCDLMDIEITEKEVNNILAQARTRRRFSGIEIADRLTEDQIATFSLNRYRFPEIRIVSDLKRYYPFKDVTTHAIGYVSKINEDNIATLTKLGKIDNYDGTTAIGKSGIESYYEDILHGITGSKEVEVNSHGKILRTLNYTPPTPGKDIILTLDIRLQQYAKELLEGMKGAIIAVEPKTGGILAFYSNPSYDPNLFVRGIRQKEYDELLNNPNRPLFNRLTQGLYAPASTIKPLLAIMGLNEDLITTQTKYFGGPAFMLPGSKHKFRDWRSWGHGWLDVYRSVELSADTFFYDLAYRAGINTIHKYLDLYGFGRSTGIDIKEEANGTNPSPEWKKATSKQSWHIGDTIPIGIGQGYWTTTLVQLAKAHSMLANNGRFVTLHLMKDIVEPKNSYIITPYIDPEYGSRFEVKDKKYFDVARAGMYLVINGEEGTGRNAFHGTKYKAAGKSGTAQIVTIKQGEKYNASNLRVEHRDNALFVAFAPYYKPRILAAIILENEGGGSAKGAPIIRKLMDKYFELYPDGYMGEKITKKVTFGLGGEVDLR